MSPRPSAAGIALLGLLAFAACSPSGHPVRSRPSPWQVVSLPVTDLPDTSCHALAVPDRARADRLWSRYRTWQRNPDLRERRHLPRRVALLRELLAADPRHVAAWLELGRHQRLVGRPEAARRAFANAARVRPCDPRVGDVDTLADRIVLALSWLDEAEGRWDDGLRRLAAHAGQWTATSRQEARILRGLLLAGAGRWREAEAVALTLPPTRYDRRTDFDHLGTPANQVVEFFRPARSGYAARWIMARLLLASGHPALARHALGHLAFTRRAFPLMARYWNDVGIVCEAAGDTITARLAYGLAMASLRPWQEGIPFRPVASGPAILGWPRPSLPAFASVNGRYLCGSPFTHAVHLLARCAQATDSLAVARYGRAAVAALDRCRRLGLHPVAALALRGRVHYYTGHYQQAAIDLAAARDSLARRGERDPVTSLVLGVVLLETAGAEAALPPLREAVALDPTQADGWRALGVALAMQDSLVAAERVLGRAIPLAPDEADGWYDRALVRLRRGAWAGAVEDLERAGRLRPGDARITALSVQLGDYLERRARATGKPTPALPAAGAWPRPDVPAPPSTASRDLDAARSILDRILLLVPAASTGGMAFWFPVFTGRSAGDLGGIARIGVDRPVFREERAKDRSTFTGTSSGDR